MNRRWLWFVVAIAIVVGIVFRVEHSERRMFWGDETWTALRVSGHTYVELRAAFDDRVHSTSDLLRFQSYDSRRGVGDTIRGLAVEEPQHAPLFYIVDHYWARLFGSSIPSLRAPAILFSLAAITAIGWLALELTGDWAVAAAAVAFMAVSPFFVNYAAQAREYGLWAAMLAATSTLLLRALRRPSIARWVWYGVALAIGFYSDLLMICVLAAHAIFVLAVYRRSRHLVVSFAVTALASLVAFAPWIVVCIDHARTIQVEQSWAFNPYPIKLVIEKWVFNAASVLFDAEYANMRLLPLALLLLLVTIYAAVRFFREEAAAVRWFLATIGGVIAAQQILTDVATHGHESTTARYLLPLWCALLVMLAMLFGRRMSGPQGRLNPAWFTAFCLVLGLATFSTALNSRAVEWWDNNDNTPSTTMAEQINAAGPSPFVVTEGHWSEVLVMAHYVTANTKFFLFKFAPRFPIPMKSPAFLLMPSQRTLTAFERHPGYDLVPVPIAPSGTQALEAFHENVAEAQHGLRNRIRWDTRYLFRLERRVARR